MNRTVGLVALGTALACSSGGSPTTTSRTASSGATSSSTTSASSGATTGAASSATSSTSIGATTSTTSGASSSAGSSTTSTSSTSSSGASSSSGTTTGLPDSGPADAGADAGSQDAGTDGGLDAGVDGGQAVDAGPLLLPITINGIRGSSVSIMTFSPTTSLLYGIGSDGAVYVAHNGGFQLLTAQPNTFFCVSLAAVAASDVELVVFGQDTVDGPVTGFLWNGVRWSQLSPLVNNVGISGNASIAASAALGAGGEAAAIDGLGQIETTPLTGSAWTLIDAGPTFDLLVGNSAARGPSPTQRFVALGRDSTSALAYWQSLDGGPFGPGGLSTGQSSASNLSAALNPQGNLLFLSGLFPLETCNLALDAGACAQVCAGGLSQVSALAFDWDPAAGVNDVWVASSTAVYRSSSSFQTATDCAPLPLGAVSGFSGIGVDPDAGTVFVSTFYGSSGQTYQLVLPDAG